VNLFSDVLKMNGQGDFVIAVFLMCVLELSLISIFLISRNMMFVVISGGVGIMCIMTLLVISEIRAVQKHV